MAKSTREQHIEELLLNIHNMRQRVISHGKFLHPEADITFSQWVALEVVEKSGGASIDAISKALHISSSAATQLVNGLQKKGFVARRVEKRDRRVSSIELSKKAKKIVSTMRRKKAMQMKKVFSKLTDKDLKTFVGLVKKIIASV